MNWSLAFEPLLSWPWLAAAAGAGALSVAARPVAPPARRRFRFAGRCAALALALLNPVMLDEEREPLKSVVALVVDRSQSQDIAGRADQTTRAVEGLKERLARFKQFEVRVVEAGRADAADERAETRLFGALDSAFRDVPPSRIAGAVMVTDGQVHDVPPLAGLPTAPLHALITGDEGEQRPPHPLREGAALRHRRQAAGAHLPRHRHRPATAARSTCACPSMASSRPSSGR